MVRCYYTDIDRENAAKLLSFLVRWANWAQKGETGVNGLTSQEQQMLSQIESVAKQGGENTGWFLRWESDTVLRVQTKQELLQQMCGLPQAEVRKILNTCFKQQTDPKKKTFLGILTDHRKHQNEVTHFTLKLWSWEGATNVEKMNQQWRERYPVVMGREWRQKDEFSSMRPQSEPDTELPESSVEPPTSPTIDVTPSPPTVDSSIIQLSALREQPPMSVSLDSKMRKKLRDCLMETFLEADFAIFLDDYLDVDIAHYASSSPSATYTKRMFDVVKRMNGQGKIVDLVRGAVQAEPDSPDLQFWREWLNSLD